MNIIFVGKPGGRTRTVTVTRAAVILASVMAFVMAPSLLVLGGYWVAQKAAPPSQDELLMSVWQQEMLAQREEVAGAQRRAHENMDALALRLGGLQAKVIRLDALGERLTEVADLDKGEFDFSSKPAVGGPELASAPEAIPLPDFVQSLESLSRQLDDRANQLGLLETMLMSRNLQDAVFPAGRPIKRGWISSYYGMRTDPFSGRREHHKGMDFAGKAGSEVIAVGAGVVTWAGSRYGYGNLVEINHGKGYVTRYGHNETILVGMGDAVKKGQALAKMGSTGRSTGPHVHFEVHYKGQPVDPKKYILASR
ncbi:Peptidase, M23/M37 family [hydrothermal vent metagenome]|uniref:Peptidase, M23/M37 family n=1 Tax=hydrothermal vent metagenome TaxID=652676 RepID=A0A3B1AB12_9ZZZZ